MKNNFYLFQTQMSSKNLLSLPTDILSNMFTYLEHSESGSLVKTCKEMKNACKENGGFLRKISLTQNTKGNEYLQNYANHSRSIERVYLESQADPHLWIFRFPKLINCSSCELTEPFIPNGGRACETEILSFRNIDGPYVTFKTDWSLFPKLKRLVLYVNKIDFELTELEALPHLDTIMIYTKEGTYKRDGTSGKIEFKANEAVGEWTFNGNNAVWRRLQPVSFGPSRVQARSGVSTSA